MKEFNTKRPTHKTYGPKPHVKTSTETLAAASPGLGPKAYDMRVLGILNQVVQEPVVRLVKRDIPLPQGTITIQPTGEGKCLIRGEVSLGFLFLFLLCLSLACKSHFRSTF